jgi:transcriptional regulator with XRE-family HTH domain
MGSHRVYRQRKYEFGQRLFDLRTRLALTQGQLAEQIGVHWHSVQKWETGESYPKAETLRRLIAVCLHHGAFTAGQEREEAQSLWQQVSDDGQRRLASFDHAWFDGNLPLAVNSLAPPTTTPTVAGTQAAGDSTPPSAHSSVSVTTSPEISPVIIDLGEVIAVPQLVGREPELATLRQWAVADRCRVVTVVGLGGIGKSSLALIFAQQALAEFEIVLFRSLQNGPPLAAVLDHTILTVSSQQAIPPEPIADKIALLVQLLRERRCLLILDNFESLLQPGALTGTYRTGYAEYSALIQALSEREHQSCLMLTSREKPSELGRWESRQGPVRTLLLTGLADEACRRILATKDIVASATRWRSIWSQRRSAICLAAMWLPSWPPITPILMASTS